MTTARDHLDGLRCRVVGCAHVIRAWTGLQEVEKLRAHFRQAHLAELSMVEALEVRAAWERRCEGGCGRDRLDGHLTCGAVRCDEAGARARRRP